MLFLSLHYSYKIFSCRHILEPLIFRFLSMDSESSAQPCFCDEGWEGYHCEVRILYRMTTFESKRNHRLISSCYLNAVKS